MDLTYDNLKETFMTEMFDRYIELEPPGPNGETYFRATLLETIAEK